MTMYYIEDLMQALYTSQLQEAENVGYDLLSRLDIDNMSGKQLENIAKMIGQGIISGEDATLRIFIKGKIGQNSSRGVYEDIYNILATLVQADDSTIIRINEYYPAAVELVTDGTIPAALAQDIFDFMQKSLGAGVQLLWIRPPFEEGGWFRFSDATGSTPYTDSGFNIGKLGYKTV